MNTIDQNYYTDINENLYQLLKDNEALICNLNQEESSFMRFNKAKVRQTGLVVNSELEMKYFIKDDEGIRTLSHSLSLSAILEDDKKCSKDALNWLRETCKDLPIDPYIAWPSEGQSSNIQQEGHCLSDKELYSSILDSAQGYDFTGIYSSGNITRAFSNSLGLKHWFTTNNFVLDYSLFGEGERSVKALYSDQNWQQEKFQEKITEAKQQLDAMSVPTQKLERGSHRVYLAPMAVAEILDLFCWGCASEASIQQGDSALQHLRKKSKSFSEKVNLYEDFSHGDTPRFNGLGELSPETLPIIKAGQLENTLISQRSANEYQLTSNGATGSESPRALSLSTGDLKQEDILKTLDNGIWISNLHYLNWSDRPNGRFTGMTRYACFQVENGKLVSPIDNMRFDDTLFQIFGESMEALTDFADTLSKTDTYYWRSPGAIRAPGILLKSFELTL